MITSMQSMIHLTADIKKQLKDNSGVNADVIEVLKRIEIKEESVLSCINSIHELVQIESGDVFLNEVPTDITKAPERMYNLIEEAVKEKGLEVEIWSEIINPYIYQDIFHTTAVVINILNNAIKYTPAGGKIRYGIRQTPGETEDECIVSFICEDTGIGIAPEFLPFATKGFSREDNDINNDYPSAGLGLSIAQTLVYLMNGTLSIKSEIGKGTTVTTSQPHRYAKKEDVEKTSNLSGNV